MTRQTKRHISAKSISFVGAAMLALAGCDEVPSETSSKPSSNDITFQSFEGVYELDLGRSEESSNISTYEGLLAITWEDVCDGYTTDQRIGAVIVNNEGRQMVSDFWMTSWEAKDQSLFRFENTVKFDGRITDETRGRAERPERMAEGEISFDKPELDPVSMTSDVLYPTEYLIETIRAARAGKKSYRSLMTDGTAETIIFDTVTFIGPKIMSEVSEKDFAGGDLLQGLESWRIQMGYHDPNNKGGVPEVEIGMTLYENGIATDLVMDYGDFILNGEIKSLKALPKSGC